MISHTLAQPTSLEISSKASEILKEIVECPLQDKKNDFVVPLLEKIIKSEQIPPDDWAYAQAFLDEKHSCSKFLVEFREQISRQYVDAGKKLTAVPIITFTHKGVRYVLIMRNEGLEKSVHVNQIQWTAPGVRVDMLEKQFLKSDTKLWPLFEKISDGDLATTNLIAAAVRRIRGMGVELSEKDILNICPINRNAAGFIEMSPGYRTEYFDVDLGERDLEKIQKSIAEAAKTNRFAQWSQCFKLTDLKTGITESKAEMKESKEERQRKYIYTLSHNGQNLPVRDTTWCLLKALEYVKLTNIKPDGLTQDPWAMQCLSPLDSAISDVLKRMDRAVQFSLFTEENNRMSSARAHAYAEKAQINPEDFAYTAMKPERLVLNVIIAYLTVQIKMKDSEVTLIGMSLYKKFFDINKNFKADWDDKFKKMEADFNHFIEKHLQDTDSELQKLSVEQIADIKRVKELLKEAGSRELSDLHQSIYYLRETDLQIATIIRLHENFHALAMSAIQPLVSRLIDSEEKLERLEQYFPAERQCFGVTGPIASGKSVSGELVNSLISSYANVSSDEWNPILSESLNLDKSGFAMYRGSLTLPEAWYIKVLIWKLLDRMEAKGKAPHVVHETLNPLAIQALKFGKTTIFINTANPNGSIERVKGRGDKTGRYVSATATIGSYRWPWINFLRLLENYTKETCPKRLTIKVNDTDLRFAAKELDKIKAIQLANIVKVENGLIEIRNLKHFLHFVAHSFRVNPAPKQTKDIWSPRNGLTSKQILSELEKLCLLKTDLMYGNRVLSKDELLKLVEWCYAEHIRPFELQAFSFLTRKKPLLELERKDEAVSLKI